jgi:pimeloyl-ACP methyl ester carboxylesterase
MVSLIDRLSARYTVIAPDTPGNGLSEPLPAAPETLTMGDFADNLAMLLDALGIARAFIYGFHTGALCALSFAGRHPERAALVVANGYMEMDAALADDICRNYIVPFALDWTGSHLTWWWARLRDQYAFFPFHRQTAATRTDFDIPGFDALHTAFIDMLRAGDGYRGPYASAYRFDGVATRREARAPTLLIADETDILYPYVQRLPRNEGAVRVGLAEDPAGAEALLERTLAAEHTLPDPPPPPAQRLVEQAISHDFIQIAPGSLHALRAAGPGRPILFLHDFAGSAEAVARRMQPFLGRRSLLAIDLPGCGESFVPAAYDPSTIATIIAEALDTLDIETVDIVAEGAGASVAIALTALHPARVHRIAAPIGFIDGGLAGEALDRAIDDHAPPIVPDHAGTHVPFLWTMLRDRALFHPWRSHRSADALRDGEPDVAPETIQRRAVDWLKTLPRTGEMARALLTFPLDDVAADLTVPILTGLRRGPTRPLAIDPPGSRRAVLPEDVAAHAAALLAFFDDRGDVR